MKRAYLMAGCIGVAAFTYAIVRYHVLKGVAWEHLPLFISNKSISLAAVFFIALAYALGSFSRFAPSLFAPILPARKFFGVLGFSLAAIHAIMSLLLFSPAYYPKFFAESGQMNLIGELSMVFGVLSLFVFVGVALSSVPAIERTMSREAWTAIQRTGYLGLLLVLVHVVVMGYKGWFDIAGWPGGLPPISLIAAVAAAGALFVRFLGLIFPRR